MQNILILLGYLLYIPIRLTEAFIIAILILVLLEKLKDKI